MELNEMAKEIANHAGMPYVWEDIVIRLKCGMALPFKLKDRKPLNDVNAAEACVHYKICESHGRVYCYENTACDYFKLH